MHIFYGLTKINNASIALGFFDGLHAGHKAILHNASDAAKKNNTVSAVITFKEHPKKFLAENPPELILTLDERIEKIQETGIDNIVLLNFEDFAAMSAEDYLKNVLVKYFSPAAVSAGFNHHFGHLGEGNSAFLDKYQEKYGYKFYEIPPHCSAETGCAPVSSSAAREMLQSGNLYDAAKILGYDFFIRGIVIEGDKIASKLGFPSANIIYPKEKIKVPFGVYYARVKTDFGIYNGVLNYGFVPSKGKIKLKTEVHIINFNRNIYGSNIQISLIAKIRNQMNFDSIEKLKAQILRDTAFIDIYEKFINEKGN